LLLGKAEDEIMGGEEGIYEGKTAYEEEPREVGYGTEPILRSAEIVKALLDSVVPAGIMDVKSVAGWIGKKPLMPAVEARL
jgi:hypothetical protein